MLPPVPEQLSRTIETLYRSEPGRVLATLVRLLGDLDLAEESMHEAFAAALETWPQTGVPDKPRPWLISTARFKAIDAMRRRARRWSTERACCPHGIARQRRYSGGRRDRGRSPPSDLHLLPSRSASRRTGCAHPARSLRFDNRGDCPRISHHAGDARAANRAGKNKDSRGIDSLRSAGAAGVAGADGRGASG